VNLKGNHSPKLYPENLDLDWKKLSLSERDKEYSPSSAIGGNYAPFIQKYDTESKLARSIVNSTKYQYGKKENQIIEIANRLNNKTNKNLDPLLVFFHGGYWQELSVRESFFPAINTIKHNISFAAVEYTLSPYATIDEIVGECREAVSWLFLNSKKLGFDKNKIILAGSSAGAHLAAMCSIYNPESKNSLLGAILVSGIYEIEPLIGTSIDEVLCLKRDQAISNSPMFKDLERFPPTVVAWAENETDQFKKQSKIFTNKLIDQNVPVRSLEIENKNHFDVILDLTDFDEPLGKELKLLLNL